MSGYEVDDEKANRVFEAKARVLISQITQLDQAAGKRFKKQFKQTLLDDAEEFFEEVSEFYSGMSKPE